MPRPSRTALLAGGGLVVVLGLGALAASTATSDSVPRGVRVASASGPIDISGKSEEDARRALAPVARDARLTLRVAQQDVRLDPVKAGLGVDVEATVDEATSVGPIDRLRALVGSTRTVEPVPSVDAGLLATELTRIAKTADRKPREGAIRFTGTLPTPVVPQEGRTLDREATEEAVTEAWLREPSVEAVVEPIEVKTTAEQVQSALDDVARPAVAAPITLEAVGKRMDVLPADVAAVLRFVPGPDGGLRPELDGKKLRTRLGKRMDAIEQRGTDATFRITKGRPVVVPSKDGRTVSREVLSRAVLDAIPKPAPRIAPVELAITPPRLTTEKATSLGIREKISTFTTRHPCCAPRVKNIQTIAKIVDGHVVLPGERFDLNEFVGPRDRARGFVEAPQILDGEFRDSVGGGVSQFATTIFNAVFFAGLKDIEHKPHSYYISRYPPGREATVSFPEPDLVFENDSPTGVLITTSFTGTSITVTFWGTKQWDEIKSVTGPRTNIKPFGEKRIDRADCTPASGEQGFDIVVRRIFIKGGKQVRSERFFTRYLPEPKFICTNPR